MRDRVKMIGEEVLSRNWGILKRFTFDFRRRSGEWQRQVREVYDRGPAAAILLHNPASDQVILVRQFRMPIYLSGRDGDLLEVCAGLLDGDDPETCVRREAEEEAGIRVGTLRHAFDADMSPGSVLETVSCFVGSYDDAARTSRGGGLYDEGEDIEVVELPFAAALQRSAPAKSPTPRPSCCCSGSRSTARLSRQSAAVRPARPRSPRSASAG